MKKLFLLLSLMTLSLAAQTTSSALKAQIDIAITNKVGAGSISKANVGNNMKAVVDYVDQEVATKQDSLGFTPENIANKSTDVALGTSDTLYPTQNAVKTYVDANSGGPSKTSGQITLTGTFQVLPYDINSCAFQGGKAYLPTTTENGKEILVIATANDIEIRANAAGTNFMFVNFGTYVASVTLKTNDVYRFTYVGFGGYWKAESLQSAQYKSWRAEVNYNSIVRVLKDEIGFGTPTISNPINGIIRITRPTFFSGLDESNVEYLSTNLSNFGQIFVTLFARSYTGAAADLLVYDMAGGQTGTPAGSCIVEIRVYN